MSLFNLGAKRCQHRHTKDEHPQCFPMETKSGGELPKVLIVDIETLPMQVFVWRLGKQRVSPESVISDYFILAWSAKWLFSNKVIGDCLSSREAITQDDSRLLTGMWRLLNEADVVITHNGNNFDLPKLNTRFIKHGMKPPAPYKSIDTLMAARSKFSFSSNRLDFLASFLGLDTKIDTKYQLWKDCYRGDKTALSEMLTYNKQDVVVLENVYAKLRPWIKSHPNMALYVEAETPMCPICLCTKLKWEGKYTSNKNIYKAFRCTGCGAVGRGKEALLTKTKVKNLTSL